MKRSALILSIFILFLIQSGAADWELNNLETPFSFSNVSESRDSVQIVEIKDNNGDPIVNESELNSQSGELKFSYKSQGGDMIPLNGGLWYAPIEVGNGGEIEYELLDKSPSGEEQNVTENLTTGNLDVEILTDFSGRIRAGSEKEVRAKVTNESGVVEDAKVDLHFVQSRDEKKRVGLGFKDGEYSQQTILPLVFGKYAVHVAAERDFGSETRYGSTSTTLQTYPEEVGLIALESSEDKCDSSSMMEYCERGANIEVEFNGSKYAENVDLRLMLESSSGNEKKQIASPEMTQDGNIWSGSFTYPDINASYKSDLMMNFKVDLGTVSVNVTRNISSRYYRIEDQSAPAVFQNENYTVDLASVKYFSGDPLNASRIDSVDVEIFSPSGSTFRQFGLGEMTYRQSDGVFRNNIDIPKNAENGTYTMNVTATNKYGKERTLQTQFVVRSLKQKCRAEDNILCLDPQVKWLNVTANSRSSYTESINVSYVGSKAEADVSVFATGQVSQYLNIKPSSFTLGGQEEKVVLNYTVVNRGNFTGQIVFSAENDTEVFTRLDARVESREPEMRVRPSSLNLSQVEEGSNKSVEIDIENTGDVPLTITVSSFNYDVTVEDATISSGDTETLELVFSDIQTETGSISVKGSSDRRSVTDIVSVSANIQSGNSGKGDQRVTELRNRISDLQSRVTSTSLITRLEEQRVEVSNLEGLYDQGDLTAAEQKYNDINSELDEIEQQISTTSPPGGTSPGGGGPRPGSGGTSPDNDTSETEENQNEGGGLAIIAIIGVLILIGVIGFVLYTSYIPEEGDPLYDTLGEQNDTEF